MIKDFIKQLMFWKYRSFSLEINDGHLIRVYGVVTHEEWQLFKKYLGFIKEQQ